MSLKTDRRRFEGAYAGRSNQTWAIEAESVAGKIRDWSSRVLVVAASPDYGAEIAGLFDSLAYRDSYLSWPGGGEPSERLAGTYKGEKISVFHFGITPSAYGASYMDMALESLRNGPARTVVVIGELSSLQEDVAVGSLVTALSAIRADDSHMSYAPPEVPAVADFDVIRALEAAATAAGRPNRTGVVWSCGAGAGIYDAHLVEQALAYNRLGVLGNAVEAATAYLLGRIVGLRVGSLWLAADGIFEPITWKSPSPRLGWEVGWKALARVGLDALASLPDVPSP
jgi:purine-nucleoside phosphorylase